MKAVLHTMSSRSTLRSKFHQSSDYKVLLGNNGRSNNHTHHREYKKPRVSSGRDSHTRYSSISVRKPSKLPRMAFQSLMEKTAYSDKFTARKAVLVKQPSSGLERSKVDKSKDSRQVAPQKSPFSRLGEGKICNLRDDLPEKPVLESTCDDSRVKPDVNKLRISDQVDFMATNAEKVKRKYPPRRKVSGKRDFPPQILRNNAPLHGSKEVDKVVDFVMHNTASSEAVLRVSTMKNNKEEDENDETPNTASSEAVSRVSTVKNNKDEDENDKTPINERVTLCLERAEQKRGELSLELEQFKNVANVYGSLINTFTMLPPPEHKVAEIHKEGDSHQVPVIVSMNDCQNKKLLSDCKSIEVFNGSIHSQEDFDTTKEKIGQRNNLDSLSLPKLPSLSHSSMPLSKTSGDKRRKVSARSMDELAQGSTADSVKQASNRRGADKKLEIRGLTSQKVDGSSKETQEKEIKNGIQSPRGDIFESSKSLNHFPCGILDTSDFTSSRSLQPQLPISPSIIGVDKDDREKVQETLRLFRVVFRKLSQENKAKPQVLMESCNKIVFRAREYVKLKNKLVNTGKPIIGPVPGVEVGDEFRFKVELNIIGLHHPVMGGIDFVKRDRKILATSIVSSGRYGDNLHNSNVLIYTGQGGNVLNSNKQPEDQKPERGNLALVNSMQAKNPVRVIRSEPRLLDSAKTTSKIYVYDGLYLVEKCWQEVGPRSKLVFKFRLRRIPGQPELSWRIMKLKNLSS